MAARADGFHMGIKVGAILNSMSFSDKMFESSRRGGFAGGLMVEYILPVTQIGFDASMLYVRRSNRIDCLAQGKDDVISAKVSRDYLDIPINLKWNLGMPVIGRWIKPYLATGPDFSILLSDKNVKKAWRNHKMDVAWNFGFGLTIVDKLQLGATYGLGISNAGSADAALYGDNPTKAKNRFWVVTAAYLF